MAGTAARIARARAGDLAALVATFGQERYFRDRLDRQLRGAGDLLVAWCDGQAVGDLHLVREPVDEPEIRDRLPGVPQISHLEVSPAYRRRGVASALLAAAERLALEHGHAMVCLGVGVDNPARSLYAARGYVDWDHGTVVFRWTEPGPDGQSIAASETCHVLLKFVDPLVPGLDAWDAWSPAEAAAVLAGAAVPWYVAAGWAIDLHLGRQTRDHGDLEIALPRSHFSALRPVLDAFDLYDAGAGVRRLGPADDPDPEHHQIWVCEPAVPAWRMDVFLEPGDADTWISQRDPRVRAPLAWAVARSTDGIPYLRPEIVLFMKAKHARDKDEADLVVALPTLDPTARGWLAEAIALVHDGHRWLNRLR